MNYHQILENIYMDIRPYAQVGKQADYIPALASVDPDQFGICINTLQGDEYALGQADTRFSIQSISKVFSLAYCMSILGDNVWLRMGKEPSGTAFNSLIQLELEKGYPRNPFINAGAIVMSDIDAQSTTRMLREDVDDTSLRQLRQLAQYLARHKMEAS